jgi:hypothetical protein
MTYSFAEMTEPVAPFKSALSGLIAIQHELGAGGMAVTGGQVVTPP